MSKVSIRFFDDREVRAVWDEVKSKWLFSVVDVCAVLSDSFQPRKYWNNLKTKLLTEKNELSEKIGQLKLKAEDGKMRLTDVLDMDGIVALGKQFPGKRANRFIDWFMQYFRVKFIDS